MTIEKSIQEFEKDYWPDQKQFPTGLIERCHNYRKIKLKDLQIHQIITLLIKDIGADYLLPIALERMDKDLFEEDDEYGNSFIESIDLFSAALFKRNPSLHSKTLNILERKKEEIEGKMGWKRYERIHNKMKDKVNYA